MSFKKWISGFPSKFYKPQFFIILTLGKKSADFSCLFAFFQNIGWFYFQTECFNWSINEAQCKWGIWGNTDFFQNHGMWSVFMIYEWIQKILIPRVCVPQKMTICCLDLPFPHANLRLSQKFFYGNSCWYIFENTSKFNI